MEKTDEYLLLAYLVPMIVITWAMADINSLLVVAQLVTFGFLVFGVFHVLEELRGFDLSHGANRRLLFAGYLAYYLPAAGVLLTTVCLQQVMAKAQQGPKP